MQDIGDLEVNGPVALLAGRLRKRASLESSAVNTPDGRPPAKESLNQARLWLDRAIEVSSLDETSGGKLELFRGTMAIAELHEALGSFTAAREAYQVAEKMAQEQKRLKDVFKAQEGFARVAGR